MPLPKHVCWGQRLEYDSLSDSSTEPKNVRSNIFARGGESDLETAKDSYSFHGDADYIKSPHDDSKTHLSYPKTCASVEHSTSSAIWGGNSSEIGLYSLEKRSLTKASSSKSESLSICEELDCLHHDYGLHPSDNYEDHLLEFGSYADCSCSEYQNDGIEHCTDKDLDDLLYSNGVAPSNYVLSSGRWPVNQGALTYTKTIVISCSSFDWFTLVGSNLVSPEQDSPKQK
ncbi:hypothetical protein Pfo_028896 [Paulownia fortunei]|nr:hypothetical protein Pfo_028896 [Paulownia fortunei]